MKVRKMSIQDYAGVHELWVSPPGMGLNNLGDSRQGIEKYLSRNPNTCFVAVKDERIVGAVVSGHDGRRGYIYHAAVAVGEGRRGIFGSLLQAALAVFEGEGISKVAV